MNAELPVRSGESKAQPTRPVRRPTVEMFNPDLELPRTAAVADGGGSNRGPLATGGTVPPGGTCSCDSDCASTANQCERTACVEDTAGAPGTFRCETIQRAFRSECNLDGLYCTYDYCDTGVCIAAPLIGGGVPRTPCVHVCSGGADDGERCWDNGECAAPGTCVPRISAGGVATCNEAADRCETHVGGAPVGRCCTGTGADDGACSYTTAGACAGQWRRLGGDPFDLNYCDCPEYAADTAPIDEDYSHDPQAPDANEAIYPVVSVRGVCSINRNPCWNAALDCRRACDAGANQGLFCVVDGDCPGGLCVAQTCDIDTDRCPATGSSFYSVGDDYTVEHGSHFRLREMRFRGGVDEENDTLIFEFFDNNTTLVCSDGVGSCAGLAVGDACSAGAATCVGPLRVTAGAFTFGTAGTENWTLSFDCGPSCDSSFRPLDEEENPEYVTLPPTGFVVMRAGIGVTSNNYVTNFSAGHWVKADPGDVSVGSNNVNSMWIDNALVDFYGDGTNTLHFELVGEPVSNPAQACCVPPIAGVPGATPATCADTQRWECRTCKGGPYDGQVCRSSVDCGGFSQGVCDDTDWKGKRFKAAPAQGNCASGICDSGACCDDVTGECTVELDTNCVGAGQTYLGDGTSCDPNCCTQTFTAGDCCADLMYCNNGGGVCTVDGDCGPGGLCNQSCTGAIAFNVTVPSFTDGACSHDRAIACDLGDLFCGECVGDPSADDECNQPLLSGGEACGAGGTCQVLGSSCDNVPVRLTRTFSGITPVTSAALFTLEDGDDCTPSALDPGWYEVIVTDDCATLVVDSCCTTPILSPAWVVISECEPGNPGCKNNPNIFWDECSRNSTECFTGLNSNILQRCTDNNIAVQWTLPAGRYAYGIYAAGTCDGSGDECISSADCPAGESCQDNSGAYQGHWTIIGCPDAACCTNAGENGPGSTCTLKNQLECEGRPEFLGLGAGGDWLGDPTLSQGAVADCAGTPCAVGACCTGPGTCIDNAGAGITDAQCASATGGTGVYHGGVRCADEPCPTCEIEDPANCQLGQEALAFNSSGYLGFITADDFRPATTTLDRICWRGTWSDACENAPPDDNFQVRIYPTVNGIPDQNNPVFDAIIQPDGASNDGDATFLRWTYSAPLTVPPLTIGQCYWLEIMAQDAVSGCSFFWLATNQAGVDEPAFEAVGNNLLYQALDGVYDYGDAIAADMTWCVSSGQVTGGSPGIDHGCGLVSVACCIDDDPNTPAVGDPTCVDNLDIRECVEFPYRGWPITDAVCSDNLCPGEPANDDFANAEAINLSSRLACNDVTGTLGTCQGDPTRICNVVDQDCKAADLPCVLDTNTHYECFFEADNRQANRDGLKSTGSLLENSNCFPSGATSLQADVWYTLTNNTCTGDVEIRGCDGDYWYDTMVDLWEIDCNSPTIPTTSRNCPDTLPCRVGCEDDGCADYFDDRTVALATLANLSVESGKCYAFRIAAWASSTAVQADGDKARVSRGLADMSMRFLCQGSGAPLPPLAATGELGMSKQRYISWVPDPTETSSYAFSVEHPLSGREYYVSTPRTSPATAVGRGITVLVSDASPILYNWSVEDIVHATGCLIAPGDQVNTAGAGHEYLVRSTADGVAFSAALSVLTTGRPTDSRWWADVVGGFSGGSWTAPNGLMNGFDITAVLRTFQNNPASPGPILERADLNPVQVDRVVNGQDVLQAVNAFGIAPYPFSVPQGPGDNGQASCPTPPTSGSLAP